MFTLAPCARSCTLAAASGPLVAETKEPTPTIDVTRAGEHPGQVSATTSTTTLLSCSTAVEGGAMDKQTILGLPLPSRGGRAPRSRQHEESRGGALKRFDVGRFIA